VAALKLILQAGANVKYTDTLNRTPLMMACDTKQHGDRVKIVQYVHRFTQTLPLMFIAECMWCACCRILLAIKDVARFIETRDSGGNSALMNAVFNNNVWLVRELLLAGASVMDKGSGVGAGGALDSAYETAKWIYSVCLKALTIITLSFNLCAVLK
jgi:ankyrin repeat protein